jgi:hypothetical protein
LQIIVKMSEENCGESNVSVLCGYFSRVSNIKMTFTLTAVVISNSREIGFRGLFWVREVLVSRTVAQK